MESDQSQPNVANNDQEQCNEKDSTNLDEIKSSENSFKNENNNKGANEEDKTNTNVNNDETDQKTNDENDKNSTSNENNEKDLNANKNEEKTNSDNESVSDSNNVPLQQNNTDNEEKTNSDNDLDDLNKNEDEKDDITSQSEKKSSRSTNKEDNKHPGEEIPQHSNIEEENSKKSSKSSPRSGNREEDNSLLYCSEEIKEIMNENEEKYLGILSSKCLYWTQSIIYFLLKIISDVSSVLFVWFLTAISLLHLTVFNSIYQVINIVSLPTEKKISSALLFVSFFGVYLEFFRVLFVIINEYTVIIVKIKQLYFDYKGEIMPNEEEIRKGISLETKRRSKFIYHIILSVVNCLFLIFAMNNDVILGNIYIFLLAVFLLYTIPMFWRFTCGKRNKRVGNDQSEEEEYSVQNKKGCWARLKEKFLESQFNAHFKEFLFVNKGNTTASILAGISATLKPNLFDSQVEDCRWPSLQIYIRWICIIYVILSVAVMIGFQTQDFIEEIPLYDKYIYSAIYFASIVMVIPIAVNFNIFDIIINYKRTERVIGEEDMFYVQVMFFWYILLIFVLICVLFFVHFYPRPYIEYLEYIEDNSSWIKLQNNATYEKRPLFCEKTSVTDNLYQLEDLAIMTTLPRLYGKTKNGQFFIKPNMRGVFNSTMKYIFGKDYMKQGIQIYCAGRYDTPYLVISSDKLLESTKKLYPDIPVDAGKVNPNKVNGTDYFGINTLCIDGKAARECSILKECISKNNGDCNKEWEEYTNKYWECFSDDLIPLNGLEEFQINMEFPSDSTFIKPRISTEKYKLSGTHFIVGGGFESTWEYSYLIDILIKKYIPNMFRVIIPFYSMYLDNLPGFFKEINTFGTDLMHIESIEIMDIGNIYRILKQIGLQKNNVFMVGHSISAATFKGISYLLDYPGVFLETVEGRYVNLQNSYLKERVTRKYLLNIYEEGSFVSGFDKDVVVNGMLIPKFFNPNVFDTACLVSTMCSPTKKYVPFCQQVLAQHGEDPKELFDKMLNEYLEKMQQSV